MDPSDLKAFFDGLAHNRSIECLEIYIQFVDETDDHFDEIIMYEQVFGALFPFFQFNNNLQVFDMTVDMVSSQPTPLKVASMLYDAILAAKSLKSIRLSLGPLDWKVLTRLISEKEQIHHLKLDEGTLSGEACVHIRSLLSNKQCALKSLALGCVLILSLGEVMKDLAKNQSIKCLYLGRDCTTHFIDSLKHQQFSNIEKIWLDGDCDAPFPNLHEFLNQMANVKSLKISNFGPGSFAKETSHAVGPSSISSLRELIIQDVQGEEVPQELSSFISNNTTLKVLKLSSSSIDEYRLPSSLWVNFFNAVKHAKHLESIDICRIITDDAAMISFSDWIVSTQTLKILKVGYYSDMYITPVGWQSFATALASLGKLEDISTQFCLDDDLDMLDYHPGIPVLNAFISKPTLQRVQVSVTAFAQLQLIANIIGSPDCNITELEVIYHNHQTNWETEHHPLTETLVDSLQRNTSLRTLRLMSAGNEGHDEWLVPLHWPLVSDLLCNTSCIDATVQSNHTLESISVGIYISISIGDGQQAPVDIFSILHMNRNTNKHAVIREKILRNHKIDQVNFVSSSLPVVFSWLGATDVDQKLGLSQLYGLLRTMPHLIQKKDNGGRGLKRKELQLDGDGK